MSSLHLVKQFLQAQSELGVEEIFLNNPIDFAPLKQAIRHFKTLPPATSPESQNTPQRPLPHVPIEKGGLLNAFKQKTSNKTTSRFSSNDQKRSIPKSPPPSSIPNASVKPPELSQLQDIYEYLAAAKYFQTTDSPPLPAIHASGPQQAQIAIVCLIPTQSDLKKQILFSGDEGALLTKMLGAIKIERSEVYCTSILKHPSLEKSLTLRQKNQNLRIVQKELALTGCKIILLLGAKCCQLFLKRSDPFSQLRQKMLKISSSQILESAFCAAGYHPAELIRFPHLKKDAWQDLLWLKTQIEKTLQL